MSSLTWTPREVASNAVELTAQVWRAVEAQHRASTTRLVDNLHEQELLERLVEGSKPARPPSTERLHYLLATPFRYRPPHGSRFRGRNDPGVFYAAPHVRTALAELGYWRWRFLLDSPDLSEIPPVHHTVFQVAIRALAVDLMRQPFVKQRRKWSAPWDYRATLAFANVVREAGVGIIQYESVRDPEHAACVAVMTPGAFTEDKPLVQQTWQLQVNRARVFWLRDGDASWQFAWKG